MNKAPILTSSEIPHKVDGYRPGFYTHRKLQNDADQEYYLKIIREIFESWEANPYSIEATRHKYLEEEK